MRARRVLLSVIVVLLIEDERAAADYLRVQREAVVHERASADADEVARVARGTTLSLRSARLQRGYYRVSPESGGEGWIYKTFVRRFPGHAPGEPAGGNAPEIEEHAGAASGGADASAFAPTDCPPEGTAARASLQQLNRLKNRAVGPAPGRVKPIQIEDLIFPGDDRTAWTSSQAVELIGYVYEVKPGGIETCNCGATDPAERDTHIEIIRDPDKTSEAERVIVEVTPTWRRFMARTRGVDWSTATLRTTIKGKWVKLRGWMLFDEQHAMNAVNANPNGSQLWRATAWEVHPITDLQLVPTPVQ